VSLRRNQNSKNSALFIGYFTAIWLIVNAIEHSAWALEAATPQLASVPCALLENFGGDVEVLDPSRTRVVSTSKTIGIPCGGWVSSGQDGWAIIRHRDGHELRVGAGTFLEIPENQDSAQNTGKLTSDQVVLYRGEMFATTEGGAGELRVITANSRVRIKRGTALINFSPTEQDTQLVALDAPASLENRFETEKKVEVKAGESTSLNFKLLRVIPSFPKAISIASLKSKLAQFRIGEKDQTKIYETAQARAERRMAADLSNEDKQEAPAEHADEKPGYQEKTMSDRRIASASTRHGPKRNYSYSRTPVNSEEAAALKARWVKKMTAGEDVGEKILYPDKFYGKPQKVKLLISDPAEKINARKHQTDDAEKRRLIEELSQIRDE
jgi:hypothetical protein